MFYDIDDSWNFNIDGDLKLTTNYADSIKHRILCPLHYLNIYYTEYGSKLYQQLGERFNRNIVNNIIEETLKQDVNILKYEIRDISFKQGILKIDLKVNSEDIFIVYDEISKAVLNSMTIKSIQLFDNVINIKGLVYEQEFETEVSLINMFNLNHNLYYSYEIIDYFLNNYELEINMLVNGERKTGHVNLHEYLNIHGGD